jgi:hypothetical protein
MNEKNIHESKLPEAKGFIYNMIGGLARNKTTVYLITFLVTSFCIITSLKIC